VSRSITTRLILAFLLVGITVVGLASGITYWLTVREFKQLTFDQARDRFVADMAFYYQTKGSWDGVLAYYELRSTASSRFNPPPGGPGPLTGGSPPPLQTIFFALADQGGHVLIPAGQYQVGQSVAQSTLSQGTAITVDQVQVGTALVTGNLPPLGGLEQRYLNSTNLALLYTALGASALALVLGIVLARALTHPIRDLTTAIRAMAGGDLNQHVAVKSRDELGELAAAFNQMSSDLDRLSRSRRQMTADIAHDLRNPLTVIGGYVESMREGVLKPTPERLDAIQVEVRHLERLVDDLRTLSQAEAGELRLNREPVAVAQLLEVMVQSYRPLAEKQGITLKAEAEKDLPELNVDPDRLAQVLGNAITNSLRYTESPGGITLRASRNADHVILTVSDTGKGIAPEALPHVFDRFYRGDSSRTDADESGLGLAIAKSIVEAHGGAISALSTPGLGTTIKITLPLERQGASSRS
jgi:two-component system sensor histidine kinase BaeS